MNYKTFFKIILCFFFFGQPLFCHAQDPLAAGEHFAPVNGIRMHYYVAGKGPVCLFPSPGWGASVELYKNSMKPFEKYFTMVYYDTRKTGKSTGPADSTKYTSQNFMDDMDSLRSYLSQPKVWIMGHSMGGFQVLNYGIHHSDKLNGIIAIAAMAGRDSLYEAEFSKQFMKRKGQPYFEKAYEIYSGKDTTKYTLAGSMDILMPFYFHDAGKLKSFNKFLGPDFTFSEKAGRYTQTCKFGSEYLFPELKKIKVPTLIIVGDDDFICDKISQADRIVKNISGATEVVIPDAGHFSWIENPKVFFSKSTGWLEAQHLTAHK